MTSRRQTVAVTILFLGALSLWVSPARSAADEPPPPRFDWQELEDIIREDPEIAVGEEMC